MAKSYNVFLIPKKSENFEFRQFFQHIFLSINVDEFLSHESKVMKNVLFLVLISKERRSRDKPYPKNG